MTMGLARWAAAALLGMGCGGAAPGVCDDLCRELVFTCDYQAFPSLQSCLDGCAYQREQGADLDAQLGCVQQADCDTFAVVECEHAHGPG